MGFWGFIKHDIVSPVWHGFEATVGSMVGVGLQVGATALGTLGEGVFALGRGIFTGKWGWSWKPTFLAFALASTIPMLWAPWWEKKVVTPEIQGFGQLLGEIPNQNAPITVPAVCGPDVKIAGKEYQQIAVPLAPGATPSGPTQTDPQTGQTVQLVLVPPSSCANNEAKVTMSDIANTPGLIQAFNKAGGSGN